MFIFRYAKSIVMTLVWFVTFYYGVNMFLDASIREQDFQENIRESRCERMDYTERNAMKGYCE